MCSPEYGYFSAEKFLELAPSRSLVSVKHALQQVSRGDGLEEEECYIKTMQPNGLEGQQGALDSLAKNCQVFLDNPGNVDRMRPVQMGFAAVAAALKRSFITTDDAKRISDLSEQIQKIDLHNYKTLSGSFQNQVQKRFESIAREFLAIVGK